MNEQITFDRAQCLLVLFTGFYACTASLHANHYHLDNTFGTQGIVTTTVGTQTETSALRLQSDGKFLIAGSTVMSNNHKTICSRYSQQGSLDETFGTNGIVTLILENDSYGRALLLQPGGELLLGGANNNHVMLVRLLGTGQVDNTFGNLGTAIPNLGSEAIFRSIAYDANNQKIIAVGDIKINGWQHILLVRFDATGNLDTSFGTNGVVILQRELLSIANSVALQSDGKIVVAGILFNGEHKGLVARFAADGTLDTTFGVDGLSIIKLSTALFQQIAAMTVQTNNKIVVAGSIAATGPAGVLLAQLNADGSLDNTFGANGITSTAIELGANIYALAVQNDGKLVVAGETQSSVLVARYTSTGDLDTTFGTNGMLVSQIGQHARAQSIAIQPDGKIVIAGTTDDKIFLARYRANNSDFVNITAPAAGSTQTSNIFEIAGIASQPNATLRVKLDNTEFSTTTTDSSGRWSLGNKLIADGEHTLSAEILDVQTVLATSTTTFTIAPTEPHRIIITAPTDSGTLTITTPTIAGIAGRASANVRIKLDGSLLDTVTTNSTGGWSKTASLIVNGAHTILAELMNGETIENSDTKNFTVTVANFITCTSPVPRSTITTPTTSITGTASDANVELQILVDGQLFNVVTTDASGHWDAGTSNVLTNGRHSIIVLATTAEGSLRIAATQYFMVNVA